MNDSSTSFAGDTAAPRAAITVFEIEDFGVTMAAAATSACAATVGSAGCPTCVGTSSSLSTK